MSSFVRKRCEVKTGSILSVGGGRREDGKFAMGGSEVVHLGT